MSAPPSSTGPKWRDEPSPARQHALILVATGPVFGLFMGLLHAATSGDSAWDALAYAIVSGLLFGSVMSVLLGPGRRGAARDDRKRPVGPRPQVDLVVVGTPPAVADVIRRAFEALPARVGSQNGSCIRARTRVSRRSWGEILKSELRDSPNGTSVRLSSRPRLPTTVVDHGIGRERVQAVVDALEAHFPAT